MRCSQRAERGVNVSRGGGGGERCWSTEEEEEGEAGEHKSPHTASLARRHLTCTRKRCTHKHTHTHKCLNTQTCIHTHCTFKNTHTCTHATHTHTHRQSPLTHTHKPNNQSLSLGKLLRGHYESAWLGSVWLGCVYSASPPNTGMTPSMLKSLRAELN